jgi:nucleoside 2-deoxyribosyltransferase
LYRVYCAGPLFNSLEQSEMREISFELEKQGISTFLPQRDGLELSKIIDYIIDIVDSPEKASRILERAIFSLDTFYVLNCDALVLNINGRVPDEGAMVEAGIAWASGKPVVIYKNDSRTLINGIDNPMILGLSNFEIISDIHRIPEKVMNKIKSKEESSSNVFSPNDQMFLIGEEIAGILEKVSDYKNIAAKLVGIISKGDVGNVERLRRAELYTPKSSS